MEETDLSDQGVAGEAGSRLDNGGGYAIGGDVARRLGEARPRVEQVCAADSCVVELLDDLEARALGEALDGALLARKRVLVRPDARRRLRAYYEGDCPIAQRLGQRLFRDGLQPLRLCMIPNVRSASQAAYGGEAWKLPLMMTWTALPPIPQHDLRLSRKESENKPGHDDRIGYREVHFFKCTG